MSQNIIDGVLPKHQPIARKITRLLSGEHTGWSLYVEDYDRAVKAMGDAIYSKVLTSGDAPANCAVAALKAIGIGKPKPAKKR